MAAGPPLPFPALPPLGHMHQHNFGTMDHSAVESLSSTNGRHQSMQRLDYLIEHASLVACTVACPSPHEISDTMDTNALQLVNLTALMLLAILANDIQSQWQQLSLLVYDKPASYKMAL